MLLITDVLAGLYASDCVQTELYVFVQTIIVLVAKLLRKIRHPPLNLTASLQRRRTSQCEHGLT